MDISIKLVSENIKQFWSVEVARDVKWRDIAIVPHFFDCIS